MTNSSQLRSTRGGSALSMAALVLLAACGQPGAKKSSDVKGAAQGANAAACPTANPAPGAASSAPTSVAGASALTGTRSALGPNSLDLVDAAGGASVTYASDIKPLITANCVSCHAAGKSMPSLDLTVDANITAAQVGIVASVTSGSMPTASPLSDAQKAVFQKWQDGGFLMTAAASSGATAAPATGTPDPTKGTTPAGAGATTSPATPRTSASSPSASAACPVVTPAPSTLGAAGSAPNTPPPADATAASPSTPSAPAASLPPPATTAGTTIPGLGSLGNLGGLAGGLGGVTGGLDINTILKALQGGGLSPDVTKQLTDALSGLLGGAGAGPAGNTTATTP